MSQVTPFDTWFQQNKLTLMKWGIGIAYLWFGTLKFFPGLSPAEGLAEGTIHKLTFGLIPDNVSIILLAIWEVAIGLIFFSGFFTSFGIRAAVVHMVLTFTPLFLLPEACFTHVPYGFTIVGQYIVKNLVFLVGLGILWEDEKQRRTRS
jgi:uncharacterized membrane protein YkgB